jgi:hypothetical protein
MTRRTLAGITIACLGLAIVGFTRTSDRTTAGMTTGRAELRSAGALALGPDGVIFVGDTRGAAIYALALRDAPVATATPVDVPDVDAKIAALLGTTRKEIVINDMVANPKTRTIYLSVSRGRGPTADAALIRVRGGRVEQVPLDSVTFSKLDIEGAPSVEQGFAHTAWRNSKRRDYTVTALQFTNGELLVTGVTNEEFASSLRRVRFPFNGKSAVTKVSMYHTSHGMYETEAPIYSFLPVTLGGTPMILAGYLCTPLVTFPMSGLTAGGTLRGTTVIELGSGNGPRDMVTFQRGGKTYVEVATGRGWMARVTTDALAHAPSLSTPVDDKGGAPFVTPSIRGVREIEALSNDAFVVLQMKADSTFALRTVDSSVF